MFSEDKITHKIYEYLMDIIKKNKYIDGFKLPSENKLAQKFNSSRMCAQLAYAKLEREKFIIKRKGSGCYINTDFVLGKKDFCALTEAKIAILGPCSTSRFLNEINISINDKFLNYEIIPSFFYSSNSENEEMILKTLITKHYDAIIYYPQHIKKPEKHIKELVDNNYPIVLIDRYVDKINAYTISSNHFASSYKIVEYLYNKGRRKILFATEPPVYTSLKHRFNGYKTALAHIPILEQNSKELFYSSTEEEKFLSTLSNYLENNETDAIITNSGAIADRIIYCIEHHNLKIGKDILLVLYDEEVSFDNIIGFPYIKLVQNTKQIGTTAASTVIDLLTKKNIPERTFNIPTILKEININT